LTVPTAIVLFLAAVLAGALNSVAGGGSFISFPALLKVGGIPAIPANATNTIALWPGAVASAFAYRRELAAQRATLVSLAGVSVVGGILGAVLLLRTPEVTFLRLLPFLLLVATLLFAFGGRLTSRLRARLERRGAGGARTLGVALFQLAIATYGGYFGGGIGILMLAMLALSGMEDIHAMNAVKTVLNACINGIAVITFIAAGAVVWPQALTMVVGAIAGGYAGAHYAQRIPPRYVRGFVIAVGFTMTGYFFLAAR
jgi:uncharacterized membrane protein YfcA